MDVDFNNKLTFEEFYKGLNRVLARKMYLFQRDNLISEDECDEDYAKKQLINELFIKFDTEKDGLIDFSRIY